ADPRLDAGELGGDSLDREVGDGEARARADASRQLPAEVEQLAGQLAEMAIRNHHEVEERAARRGDRGEEVGEAQAVERDLAPGSDGRGAGGRLGGVLG